MRPLLVAVALAVVPLAARASPPGTWHLHASTAPLDGGGGGVGSTLAFVGLGAIGTGVVGMGTLVLLARLGGAGLAGSWPLMLALPATAAWLVALGRLLDVPVSWGSAAVGLGFGVVAAFAGAFAGAALAGGGDFADLGLAILGLVAGFGLGTPVGTVLDPFALAAAGGGAGATFARARPLAARAL